MAEALGRCQDELVNMKASLASIVAAGGMQLSNESDIRAMNVVGEYLTKLIDNAGTAVEASTKASKTLSAHRQIPVTLSACTGQACSQSKQKL